jgi:Domain of unknown function (DUF5916)/Carbohydrate family 9 binding domain-like
MDTIRRFAFRFWLTIALAIATIPTAFALEPLQIPRIDAGDNADRGIVLDGALDESAWAQAEEIELNYENSPGDNIPASVRTIARVLHTDDALYIGFIADDPEPEKIRAFLRDRDALYEDDFIGLQLDTFDDQRRAYEFFVNPVGAQADGVRENDADNGDNAWDGLWSSGTRITARGYQAEMRIPFATLRFKDGDGTQRWGLRLMRIRPRDYLYVYFNEPRPRGASCDLCAMRKIEGFADARQGRNLEITPTLTVRHAQVRDRRGTAPRGRWNSPEGTEIEPGLDVAWAPTPNLTLNGTLNPDFSQVESDSAQLDLNSNFALFFPEKRPFFLESADYFNTPLNVIYTRQIADPDIGVRVTGRSGRQAYGVVVARDATTQLLVPGVLGSSLRTLDQNADALLGRYRYDLDAHTSIGAVATYRGGDGYRNALAGVDARWQQGPHKLVGQWLRSDSQYPQGLRSDDDTPAGNALMLDYRYGDSRWDANLGHTRIDPGFSADLGFIGQVGYRKSVIGGGRTWYGNDSAAINSIVLYADWDTTHADDGELLERELEARIELTGPLQSTARLSGLTRVRFWDGRLFDERWLSLYGKATPLPGVIVSMSLRSGDQLDLLGSRTGRVEEWQPTLSLDIGRGINLNLSYTAQRLHRDGGTAYDLAILDGRFSWQLDTRQRLRLSLQGSDVERDSALYATPIVARNRDLAAQLLYSYRINPRTGVYAGYSHGGYSDGVQTELTDRSRSVFLKLSYAWQP